MFTNQTPQPVKILLAVDGSEHSFAATRFVHDLPLPLGSKVLVLSVLIPREASLKMYMLEHFLEQVESCLRDKSLEVTTKTISGNPATEIIREAKDEKVDLIVMGAKGLRATLGILLGGVAQQVVEYATCPVLVVRAPYEGVQKILLAIDGSAQSEEAVNYLMKFPISHEAAIQLLHILPPIPMYGLYPQAFPGGVDSMYYPLQEEQEMFSRIVADEEADGEALLRKMCKKLEAVDIWADKYLLRGDAATEILGFIKNNQIDLVVAGSRGLGGFEGWLLGSVSRKLLHYSGCSVMIVKESA